MSPTVDELRGNRRRLYADLVIDLSLAVLAVLAVWATLASDSALGAAMIAVAGLALYVRLFVRYRVSHTAVLGASVALRSLLVAGTAVVLSAYVARPGQEIGAALAAALLIGSAAAERFLRRAARFAPPVVANLAGVDEAPTPRDLSGPVVAGNLLASMLGLVLGILGVSSWWWLAFSVLSLVPPAWLGLVSRGRVLRARQLRTLVPQAVADYAPDFLVYTSRPDDASYQVTMWLPYLERAGLRFLIVTRNSVPARALAGLTDVPIVQARRISDLDALVPPSLKAAFYVNASSGNGVFVRYQHLNHVYLGHGDSDKPPSYNPTHAMYDRVFAAGPAAARRYAAHGVRIPADKFQIVGRPQVEGVQPARRPISEVEHPVVLYAPTWRGHVEETLLDSLPVGEGIVRALLARGITVIFRPHPFSYGFPPDAAAIARIHDRLRADTELTGRPHLWGAAAETERGIFDCINASDAMVSDVSSVVSDYLFSGKPFAMVAVPSAPAEFVAEYPVARAAYVVRGDLNNLDECLEQMLRSDPKAGVRAEIRVDYLGDFPAEHYASAFVDAVRDVASHPGGTDDEEEEQDADDGPDDATSVSWASYRRLISGAGLSLLGTALSLGALAAALLEAPAGLTGAAVLISVLAGLGSVTDKVRNRERWRGLLSESAATRATLLVLTAVVLTRGPGVVTTGMLGTMLMAVALVGEPHIRSAWGRLGLDVENMPEVRSEVSERLPRGVVPLLSGTVIALLPLLALAGAPGWQLLGLSVVHFVVFADALGRAVTRAFRTLSAEGRLHDALVQLAPEFAVYFASSVGAQYQVGMWLPYFVRIGRPFVFVTRSVAMMREIAVLTRAQGVEVPVIYRPTLRSLEDVVVPSMRTAFYVNNAVRNTHFVERRELVHVWLNHGDSEKPACFNPVHAIYDLLFAAGQAGIDRYARHHVEIPLEKFRVVGRPQVESIEPARGPAGEQQPPTVLYAPTWQGPFADTRVYSLPQGRQIVEHLLERGVRVVFRAHPFNYRFAVCVELIDDIGQLLAADKAATGRDHLWGAAAERDLTIEQCFNASDAMISDVSAVVSDYLHSDKPFAIVSVGRTPEALLAEVPAAEAAYVMRQDLSNLDEVCSDLLGADPLAEIRRKTRVYYLGDFGSDRYADGFLDAAREVIDAGGR